jgi:xanthine/CO dehydrogenase XdhC/CoxF family maturation factor
MDETDTLEVAEQWLRDGHKVVLATVVRTWGSAPRPAGSHLAVRGDGIFEGSVSGGCVESAVVEAAAKTLQDGRIRQLRFGVSDEQAWSAGLACGGRIEIVLEPVDG